MKYFLVWDKNTHGFLTRGTARECAQFLGIKDVKQFRITSIFAEAGMSEHYLMRVLQSKAPEVSPCWRCKDFPNPDYQEGVVCQSCGKPSCARQEQWIREYMRGLRERYQRRNEETVTPHQRKEPQGAAEGG